MSAWSASALLLAATAGPALGAPAAQNLTWANRVTWGAPATPDIVGKPGSDRWLDAQLKRPDGSLPPKAAVQVAAMQISQKPMAGRVRGTMSPAGSRRLRTMGACRG